MKRQVEDRKFSFIDCIFVSLRSIIYTNIHLRKLSHNYDNALCMIRCTTMTVNNPINIFLINLTSLQLTFILNNFFLQNL